MFLSPCISAYFDVRLIHSAINYDKVFESMASCLPDTSKSDWIFEELESEFRVIFFSFSKVIARVKWAAILFYDGWLNIVKKFILSHFPLNPNIRKAHSVVDFIFFLSLISMISLLYGIIQNIYTMLSNELNAAIFINIGLFTCLFCLIVDIILNLNGKYGSNQCTCRNITTKSNHVCSNFGIM